MPRSLLTLAAAGTAAVTGAEATGVRVLTSGGNGRHDAAVITLADGDEIVVRVPVDEAAERALATESVALRALTSGVREVLGFPAPEFLGTTTLDDATATVTTFLPGYQVDAAEIPAGRGVAMSIGEALAAVHALPASVVRSAGLPVRTPEESRAEVERLIDAAGASGRVPVRLMVRWREAVEDDRLWGFESAVCLGGTQSTSFVLRDDVAGVPRVTGILDWAGLAVDDPAVDLRWIASAPHASRDILESYTARTHRAPDAALEVRARLHAELEFAQWLVHGLDTHRTDVVDDAADLLESLSEGIRDDRLLAGLGGRSSDVDDALAAIGRVPQAAAAAEVDTSMQTDAYDPSEFDLVGGERWGDSETDAADHTTAATPAFSFASADDDAPAANETVPLDMDEFIAAEQRDEERRDR